MEEYRRIEKSIIKKYRRKLWSKFVRAIKDYDLIQPNDHIAVCISGGKDSMLLAKCMEELKRHGQFDFDVSYIVMDPGYQEENRKKVEENLKKLHIDAEIFRSDIFKVAEKTSVESNTPCYLCARMRRGNLYAKAKELGCNKIALGHHFNDVIETILLNMIYTGQYSSMLPKLHSDNFEGMELIRPLYYIKEKDIEAWVRYNELSFIDCACSVTKKGSGKREEMKRLVKELVDLYEDADIHIFKSSENVNMNTILGYRWNGEKHSFLEYYENGKDDLGKKTT